MSSTAHALQYIKKIIGNKYLLTGVAFGVWMLFFDRNDISLQISRMNELHNLHQSEQKMTEKISETETELKSLKSSTETLEKYAREKYLMKKPNEDLFILETVKGD